MNVFIIGRIECELKLFFKFIDPTVSVHEYEFQCEALIFS